MIFKEFLVYYLFFTFLMGLNMELSRAIHIKMSSLHFYNNVHTWSSQPFVQQMKFYQILTIMIY